MPGMKAGFASTLLYTVLGKNERSIALRLADHKKCFHWSRCSRCRCTRASLSRSRPYRAFGDSSPECKHKIWQKDTQRAKVPWIGRDPVPDGGICKATCGGGGSRVRSCLSSGKSRAEFFSGTRSSAGRGSGSLCLAQLQVHRVARSRTAGIVVTPGRVYCGGDSCASARNGPPPYSYR